MDTDPTEILKEIKSKPAQFKNLLLSGSSDRKALLFLSMGHFQDMYLDYAEQMMKERGGREAGYFHGKAREVERITEKIFGEEPEKDYYTGQFELPGNWDTETSEEELNELAQFCISNLPEAPDVRDPDKIKELIEEELGRYKRRGIARKFIKNIESEMEKEEDPSKLSVLLELTTLLEVVDEVLETIKEEAEEEVEEEEEIYPGIREGEEIEEIDKGEGGLSGFGVDD